MVHDANDLVRAMQQVSKGVNDTGYPADIMPGTIIAVQPLTVRVDQRFEIQKDQLIIPERLTEHKIGISFEGKTEKAGEPEHFHDCRGEQTVTVHNSLKVGDHVILIRQQGGQKFLILDRAV